MYTKTQNSKISVSCTTENMIGNTFKGTYIKKFWNSKYLMSYETRIKRILYHISYIYYILHVCVCVYIYIYYRLLVTKWRKTYTYFSTFLIHSPKTIKFFDKAKLHLLLFSNFTLPQKRTTFNSLMPGGNKKVTHS